MGELYSLWIMSTKLLLTLFNELHCLYRIKTELEISILPFHHSDTYLSNAPAIGNHLHSFKEQPFLSHPGPSRCYFIYLEVPHLTVHLWNSTCSPRPNSSFTSWAMSSLTTLPSSQAPLPACTPLPSESTVPSVGLYRSFNRALELPVYIP